MQAIAHLSELRPAVLVGNLEQGASCELDGELRREYRYRDDGAEQEEPREDEEEAAISDDEHII